MQIELGEAKKLDQKACYDDQNFPELRPAEIEDHGCEAEQINTMKANDGQIIDQDILNAYCLDQVGLDSVSESKDVEEEKDSWHLESIKQNASNQLDSNYKVDLDGSLLSAKLEHQRNNSSHRAPIVDEIKFAIFDL